MTILERVKHAWNAFNNKDPTMWQSDLGASYYSRPDRPRYTKGNERSIVTSVYNRIAIDAAAISIKHVMLDDDNRYESEITTSGLNNCLNIEANIDQSGHDFIQDIVMSLLDEGCVAVVPVDTGSNPNDSESIDIITMRVGKIVQWYPKYVKVNLYNDRTGQKEDIIISKTNVAIIENPFYSIMNEPSSTMQRLIRKLNILDAIDEQSGSGKLDLIIQLPYVIKSEGRKVQAEQRRKDVENQLANSKYGIAYTDGTERITQLNRSIDNNLMSQIEYLTSMLYSQLGITQEIMNGTANEQTMLNYYNRTIAPILTAITSEMKRKFLTKTARTRGQSIEFYRDPFSIVPVSQIADIGDKLTRNEIASSNEIRQLIGWKPSSDPEADVLRNKNLIPEGESQSVHPSENQNEEENLYDE